MPAGRPSLPPGERKSEKVVLSLTPYGSRILDALVADDEIWETRQDVLQYLVREEYHKRLSQGMKPVKKGSRK